MDKVKQILKPAQRPINWFRKTSIRNKIIVAAVILLVGFFAYRNIQSANAKPQYITQAVERGNITQIVSETGNIETAGRVDVYSTSTGIIEEIYVEDGTSVELNQNLFKVRSTATDQEKAGAYADYISAQNTLNAAKSKMNSLKAALFNANEAFVNGRGVDNPSDDQKADPVYIQQESTWLQAEADYNNQAGVISAAQASFNKASFAYQATQNLIVKAPSSGTATNLSFKVGDKVSASSTSGAGGSAVSTTATSGTPVLTIANLTDYTVKLALNEVDVPKVENGQTAKLTLDAFPNKKFKGKVTHVDSLGTNTAGVITYNIVVEITNPEDTIRPAMTANVDIEVDKAENVLTVSNSAIKPYEGKKAVQIIDSRTKTAKYLPVEVGIKSPEKTEIKGGVQEGTQVITGSKNGVVETSGGGPFGN